jgi:hypothetical protein
LSVGQEGDTRQYRRLKRSDYYVAKAAVEASKRDPKRFPKCKNCKEEITGLNFNGYCLRCHDEPL